MQARSAIEHHDSVIGKTIVIKGEIIASVPLHVNGHVEGSISALEQRVTIGSDGKVRADISAGEVVIMGDVCGNLNGCYRVEIRTDGSLAGDLAAERICIHDGAFVKGAIESQRPSERNSGETHPALAPESNHHPETWESLAVSEPA
jgi:cytoskeletal protein CcmA (bactofilin family)